MRKVLIVEKDPVQSMAYMRAFIVAGFDVDRATNEGSAFEAINRLRPQVVLINVLLGGDKGLNLIRTIRAESKHRALPIIGFARENADDTIVAAQMAGATECHLITKAGAQELLAAVRNVLQPAAAANPADPAAFQPAQRSSPAPSPFLTPLLPAPPPPRAIHPVAALPPPPPPPPQDEIIETHSPPQSAVKAFARSDRQKLLVKLKELSGSLLRAENKATQPPLVHELYRKAEEFAADESVCNATLLKRVANVLVVLLKDLSGLPQAVNSSSMRTVNQTVNFLDVLSKHPLGRASENDDPFNVLIVDDEAIARRVVAGALGLVQLKPDTAKDPSEALELSRVHHYNLFVLDVNMPGMTGYDLCERLRKSDNYRETPVIFVTGWNTFESRLRFARSGGDDFISKPFLPPELAAKTLIHLLGRRMGLGKE